MKIDYAGPIRL